MLILKPYAHMTIWGGKRLGKYLGQELNGIGHLYTVRGNKTDANEILNGKEKGKNLYEVFQKKKDNWNMAQYEEFPISIALVDANENLSVQVHPDKEIATLYEQKAVGKNESFYILENPLDGKMINGCKCKTAEELRVCAENGMWEDVIDYLPVKQGDYVYVTAGTLHAMTKGAFTYEIEENCSYTYRLYDYDRVDSNGNRRPLDTEKALASIKVNQKSEVQRYTNLEKVEEKYATQLLINVNEYENKTTGVVCITLIEGNGIIDGIEIMPGMSVILEKYEMVSGLRIYKAIVARIL